jgi:hypothetical protein
VGKDPQAFLLAKQEELEALMRQLVAAKRDAENALKELKQAVAIVIRAEFAEVLNEQLEPLVRATADELKAYRDSQILLFRQERRALQEHMSAETKKALIMFRALVRDVIRLNKETQPDGTLNVTVEYEETGFAAFEKWMDAQD